MCYSRKVEPSVIEREMQEARNEEEFTGKVEAITIKQIVENAKVNSRFGDKILVNINPLHVHIPSWQRMCDVVAATEIGTKYNKYKWEVPKLLYLDGKLFCVDGMHRIYGAFKGKIEAVICEIIECSEKVMIQRNQKVSSGQMELISVTSKTSQIKQIVCRMLWITLEVKRKNIM